MSSYNRKSFDIAGYMFQADIVCPPCVASLYQKVPAVATSQVDEREGDV